MRVAPVSPERNDVEEMSGDTTHDALLRQLQVLREMGISGRAAMTFELSDNLRQLVRDGVRHRHPDWDETRVEREVFHIVLGDRLFDEAFGESRRSHE
jgi:hypothetical protein